MQAYYNFTNNCHESCNLVALLIYYVSFGEWGHLAICKHHVVFNQIGHQQITNGVFLKKKFNINY